MATRYREDLWRMTHRLLVGAPRPGDPHAEHVGLPDRGDPTLLDHEDIDEVGRYLFEHGQYATMAAYPLVPKNEVGFRVQVTAANTDEQIDELIEVLANLHERFQLEPTRRRAAASDASARPRATAPPRRRSAPPSHPPSTRMSVPVT